MFHRTERRPTCRQPLRLISGNEDRIRQFDTNRFKLETKTPSKSAASREIEEMKSGLIVKELDNEDDYILNENISVLSDSSLCSPIVEVEFQHANNMANSDEFCFSIYKESPEFAQSINPMFASATHSGDGGNHTKHILFMEESHLEPDTNGFSSEGSAGQPSIDFPIPSNNSTYSDDGNNHADISQYEATILHSNESMANMTAPIALQLAYEEYKDTIDKIMEDKMTGEEDRMKWEEDRMKWEEDKNKWEEDKVRWEEDKIKWEEQNALLEGNMKKSKASENNLKVEMERMRREMGEKNMMIERMNIEVREWEDKWEVSEKMKELNEEEIDKREELLVEMSATCSLLREEKEMLMEEIREMEEEMNKIRCSTDEIQIKYNECLKNLYEAEKQGERFEGEVKELRSRICGEERSSEGMEKKMKELQAQLEDGENKVKRMEENLEERDLKIFQLNSELEENMERISKLEREDDENIFRDKEALELLTRPSIQVFTHRDTLEFLCHERKYVEEGLKDAERRVKEAEEGRKDAERRVKEAEEGRKEAERRLRMNSETGEGDGVKPREMLLSSDEISRYLRYKYDVCDSSSFLSVTTSLITRLISHHPQLQHLRKIFGIIANAVKTKEKQRSASTEIIQSQTLDLEEAKKKYDRLKVKANKLMKELENAKHSGNMMCTCLFNDKADTRHTISVTAETIPGVEISSSSYGKITGRGMEVMLERQIADLEGEVRAKNKEMHALDDRAVEKLKKLDELRSRAESKVERMYKAVSHYNNHHLNVDPPLMAHLKSILKA